ncbi:Hypothetical predicted protein [Olea europaea subsp. europaea]|uniref:Uncharacterized protein n=1 Tax=Olea europaea subsp. europaea TaxID=158383 RepID=A0A8S0R8T8_OLEEU|nr:Hypothetical predicted protein [Olea europaea subsp. europaea]
MDTRRPPIIMDTWWATSAPPIGGRWFGTPLGPHACPPSCIVVPFDGLVSERFRASRSNVGKLRRAPGAQHASNNVFFGADVLLIPPREASEGWIGEGPRRIRHFRAHEREACVGKGPNRAAEVRSAMTVAVASTYCNVLRAAPGGRRTLDNVSFGAHILVLPSCERAASGAEPTQAASI